MRNVIDVVIVGGGPIGLKVAQITAHSGLDTVVLEDKPVIGKPVQCAGLVSKKVIKMTDTESVIAEPTCANIHPPNEVPLRIDTDEKKVAIIDRATFDKEMAAKANNSGVDIRLNSKFTGKNPNGKVSYTKDGERHTLDSKIIVGADGPGSTVRRSAELPGPEEIIPAVQAIVPEKIENVRIYLGNDIAPGFFAWQVPFTTGSLFGLASTDGNAYEHLNNLLSSKGLNNKVVGILSGSIPVGLITPMVQDGIVLVGDAAGQVKPLSGGGVYTGLKAAEICGETIIKSLKERDASKEFLMRYQDEFFDGVGKEIKRGLKIRKVFKGLSDDEFDKLISSLQKDKIKRIIENQGDIDHPSKLVKPIVKASPSLLKFLGPVIKSLL
ncbi:MAG: geranylgeranyl reductase family protein [Thermoplasmatota archaeon]